jgi:UDP-2-acetamido-2-deoxy-ribo-hexuluronate aminotransferase
MIANHGQEKKYVHKFIGVNSRLDTIQASILNIKLKYLDQQNEQRLKAADLYNRLLSNVTGIKVPTREFYTSHVFHQYTIRVKHYKRDSLKKYLEKNSIPSMIYYPVPLSEQEAFKGIGKIMGDLPVTSSLCSSVLSLPMHPELTESEQVFICETIKSFFYNELL